eukprot:GDKI01021692.1.p1 GENE.GDKI01021692.1~~GDKI01021692.1.p1  ORF type:complete len:618 (+),score=152.02 GDKI01021692.1:122-1975(+)
MHASLLATSSSIPSSTHSPRNKLLLAVGTAVLCVQTVFFLSNKPPISSALIAIKNGVSSTTNDTHLRFGVGVGGDDIKIIGTIPLEYCVDAHKAVGWREGLLEFRGKREGETTFEMCASRGAGGVWRDVIKADGGYMVYPKRGDRDTIICENRFFPIRHRLPRCWCFVNNHLPNKPTAGPWANLFTVSVALDTCCHNSFILAPQHPIDCTARGFEALFNKCMCSSSFAVLLLIYSTNNCYWTDKNTDWSSRDEGVRKEVCGALRANAVMSASGPPLTPQVHDAWRCDVMRYLKTEWDEDHYPMDKVCRSSEVTCVESDFVAGEGRAILKKLERYAPDTQPAVDLTLAAFDRLSETVTNGVVVNTHLGDAVSEVGAYVLLSDWKGAHVCNTQMPVWLRPLAYAHTLKLWKDGSFFGDREMQRVMKPEWKAAIKGVVDERVRVFSESGLLGGVHTHTPVNVQPVEVSVISHSDVADPMQKELWALWKASANDYKKPVNGWEAEYVIRNVFQNVLSKSGVFFHTMTHAEVEIIFKANGAYINAWKFTGVGYEYAENYTAVSAVVSESTNNCPEVHLWIKSAAQLVWDEHVYGNRKMKFSSVKVKEENREVTKVFKFERKL